MHAHINMSDKIKGAQQWEKPDECSHHWLQETAALASMQLLFITAVILYVSSKNVTHDYIEAHNNSLVIMCFRRLHALLS